MFAMTVSVPEKEEDKSRLVTAVAVPTSR